jgi:hypothetical protein
MKIIESKAKIDTQHYALSDVMAENGAVLNQKMARSSIFRK